MSKQEPVMRFYSEVLKTYWHKLEEETKRGNFGPNFMQAIKNILEKKFDNLYVLLKLKGERQKKKEQEERELKAAEKLRYESQIYKNYELQKPSVDFIEGDGDDEILYVEQGYTKQGGQELKKEAQTSYIKEEDGASEIDEEEIEKERIIASANERVEMYLIGYSNKKKYVAKTEKIMIDLDNVFIKYKDREEAFKKINCSLTKIKPSEVKQ